MNKLNTHKEKSWRAEKYQEFSQKLPQHRSLQLMDSTPPCNLHFVFIPIMAPGHLLPMVDMAKMLARRKVKVSIITTPLNSIHFQARIDREVQSGSPIQILHVQFPWAEAGLPEGSTNRRASSKPKALSKLHNCRQKYRVMADVADKKRSTKACLMMRNFLCLECPTESNCKDVKLQACREATRKAAKKAYGIVVNSFEELEAEYVKEYERVTGHKVSCVGPVSLCNKDDTEKALRNKRKSSDENKYMKWLDSWSVMSVIYVCLGSLNRATPEQLIELGLGLEATKRPFIWVLRGAYGREEMEKRLLEDGSRTPKFQRRQRLPPSFLFGILFSSNGVSVTIVLTPLNAAKLNNFIDQAKALNLQIQFHMLHFPSKEAGLQEGRENTDTLPSHQYQYLFFAASNMLKEPPRNGFQSWKHYPPASFPTSAYLGQFKGSARLHCLCCCIKVQDTKVHENVTSMSESFAVPDLPDTIEFSPRHSYLTKWLRTRRIGNLLNLYYRV
ncbi:hypothetical protein V8G54_021690 [Vigna mungo]|uniref:Uncharacterized protein n=1 Tax=Vigna mungo TaxID=3915 RepID=A0AAQ3RXL0_VIGMU